MDDDDNDDDDDDDDGCFAGYSSYIGMLLFEYTHNHPVLRVFCQILLRKNISSLVYSEKNKDVELANENKSGKLVEIKLSRFLYASKNL